MEFQLRSPFQPAGDQSQAIEKLVAGLKKGYRHQTLLGVTGSGKTFTMANVIVRVQRPTLIISHNKTLAAQLASEFEEFFPKNAVHYFVSYYDYYQPEAYLPRTDTYIEKETDLNEEIERLRHASTQALIERRDVIIVASVSCIYGLGSPEAYRAVALRIGVGEDVKRQTLLKQLVAMQYERNQLDLWRGSFRVRGDTIEVFPAFSENAVYRIGLAGDRIESLAEVDALTGETLATPKTLDVFPATHYITRPDNLKDILAKIRRDLAARLADFRARGKLLEAQRLEERTNFDLEMVEATGICKGIENYSRYFDGRAPGTPPYTLMDFFPKDFLLFIDESHMTLPQIRGMSEGDRSRKSVLVDYGFRLPAALDNRPLRYDEFARKIRQVVYVSATPAVEERQQSRQIVEQVVRPTGLLDPLVEIRPTKHQIDDLVAEIRTRVEKKQRVLVTTLTKRIAEDLTDYLKDIGVKAQYLHSDVDTLERLEILRDLRTGAHDVLVGINLLREGLDLPEVSLVAILDADKESYLRSDVALMQTMGRAARHAEGGIIMYADRVSGSMERAIAETKRRRATQEAFNRKHGITPTTIEKAVRESRLAGAKKPAEEPTLPIDPRSVPKDELPHLLADLENQMELAAKNLEFERAARLRDLIAAIKAETSRGRRRGEPLRKRNAGR